MSRRARNDRPSPVSRLIAVLAIAALIYWAGRDPRAAAALISHIGQGIAAAASHLHGTR